MTVAIKGSFSVQQDMVKQGSSLAGRNSTGTLPHGALQCVGKMKASVMGFGMGLIV